MNDDPRNAAKGGGAPRPKKPARKPFLLRLPPDLLADLRGWAESDLRSLNAHIEYLLRQAVKRSKGSREED